MVVFTPDRIFQTGLRNGGPAPLDEEKPKAGGRGRVPEGPPVLSEIPRMIGINSGRTIKSRPGSLYAMAFFPVS